MKLLIIFLVLSFTQLVAAAGPDFQLQGSYALSGEAGRKIDYTLEWSEKDNIIQGHYSDNYFVRKTAATGRAQNYGRNFLIKFPEPVKGVSSIAIMAAKSGSEDTATTIPISVVLRDGMGNPLTSTRAMAQFTGKKKLISMIPPRRPSPRETDSGTGAGTDETDADEPCVQDFGVLAGFCGFYSGTMTEENDLSNKCDLLSVSTVKLELDNAGSLFLHLDQESHRIGRLATSPESRGVDVLSRDCGPLPRTDFADDHCKRLNLSGSFSAGMDRPNFTGTYSIIDEGSGKLCKYGLSVSLEKKAKKQEMRDGK